ncbi:signal peptidase II [Thalassotalea castellviae]|uniref:Lipoprotein signal peptidase n=1 Tax=Thalassotalea castellviae TaxID=3075612 RepID=A0ABU2ZWU9_9GAMM|nr:signal peptidase II [Thalassotalea sp. W431]MDT0602411.1 signal peptidase II [Thalassotalea sp. W431]
MTFLKINSSLQWLWLTAIFLIIDQITKQWVAGSMELYQSINILPFFNITYAQNHGAAFSFLADQSGWQRWFFTSIAAIASVVFLVWLKRTPKEQPLLAAALACMLSGALGNLIDRSMFGYVIDFLDFYVKGYHWPTFNVADSIIFVGAALMIIDSFKQDKTSKNQDAKEN